MSEDEGVTISMEVEWEGREAVGEASRWVREIISFLLSLALLVFLWVVGCSRL